MRIFSFFRRYHTKKTKQRFYASPSLNPSTLERNELLSLLHNHEADSNARALRHQARSIATASPLINGYFDTLDSEIFGDNGIILDLHSQDPSLNTKIEALFKSWRECIPDSHLDFWDIESLVLLYLKRCISTFKIKVISHLQSNCSYFLFSLVRVRL